MIEELKKNIDAEIGMLNEISNYKNKIDRSEGQEKKILEKTVESLKESMKTINSTIPGILQKISSVQKLPGDHGANMHEVHFKGDSRQLNAVLGGKDKDQFLKDLSISEEDFSKLRKRQKDENIVVKNEFKKSSFYFRLSNKFFGNVSRNVIDKGGFKSLGGDLRKSNMDVLLESYVSMIYFTTLMSFVFSLFVYAFFIFFSINTVAPYIVAFSGSLLTRIFTMIWIPIILPFATFMILLYYPSTEKDSVGKRIDQELPFAVVHMSAISGSGVEPTEIFRIIGLSKEYPNLRKEVRKILNQINIFGYDLVTALNNVSRSSPSKRLSELLSGLSTTISSGGGLTQFFEKRSESLILMYRLEREKFAKSAETFMDLYITVVIAAPMVLLLIFILLSISNFGPSLSPAFIAFLIIGIIALVNVLFLGLIHIKQPRY